MMDRLAVLGVGLLGGSVAKAVRARGLAREIVGVGRDPGRLRAAMRAGIVDRTTTDIADGVRGADVILLAAPVQAIERLLPTVWAAAGAGSLVTDVGSTKASIVHAAERLEGSGGACFVGSHPMAGSERSGWEAAAADLLEGATVVVTPTARTADEALKRTVLLWERLGAARVVRMDAQEHDRAVAAISHLPHLVACALVGSVESLEPGALSLAGRGFRDTTRIAAGDPEVWREIFLDNRVELLAAVETFRLALDSLVRLVSAGDDSGLQAALSRLQARRESLA